MSILNSKIVFAVILMSVDVFAQTSWISVYGEGRATCIQETSKGNYVSVGSYYYEMDEYPFYSWQMITLLELDKQGNLVWKRVYGGNNPGDMDEGTWIEETKDGGFVVTGKYASCVGAFPLMNLTPMENYYGPKDTPLTMSITEPMLIV